MRFYYYATELKDGWSLHSSLELTPLLFPSRKLAIEAATANCRRRWQADGIPCGVRAQAKDRSWVDLMLVGDPDMSSQTPVAGAPIKDRRGRP